MKWKPVVFAVCVLALVALGIHLLTRSSPPAPMTAEEHMKFHRTFGHETIRRVIVMKCGRPDLEVVGRREGDSEMPENVKSYLVYVKQECDFIYGFDSKRRLIYKERVDRTQGRE